MTLDRIGEALVSSAVFAGIGIAVFALAFYLIIKLAPFSVRKEIEDDQNTALAIIMAGVFIGISLVIAAAVRG